MKMGIHKGFDFSALGGMPINQERLKYMQSAYAELSQAFASLIGNNVILSGCVVQGESVSEGWMILNGELVPFMGTPQKQDNIYVQEQTKGLVFASGESKNVEFKRFAVFGNGNQAVAFNSLKRSESIIQLKQRLDARTDNPEVSDNAILATSAAVNAVLKSTLKISASGVIPYDKQDNMFRTTFTLPKASVSRKLYVDICLALKYTRGNPDIIEHRYNYVPVQNITVIENDLSSYELTVSYSSNVTFADDEECYVVYYIYEIK